MRGSWLGIKQHSTVTSFSKSISHAGGLCPILSLRSTHVTRVQSTRETGDIFLK